MDIDLIIKNIDFYRRKADLTKRELAKRISMSEVGFSQMMSKKTLKIKTLNDISETLNVDINKLTGENKQVITNSNDALIFNFKQQIDMLKNQVSELQKDKDFFRELYEKERDRNDKGEGKKEGEGGK